MPQYSGLAAVFWHGLGIIVGLWPLSCESNSFLVDHSAFAMARTQPWLLSYDGRDLIYLLLQPQLWEIQRCCVIMHWNSERCHFQWHCGVCHHVPECWQTTVCVIVEFVTVQLCVLPSVLWCCWLGGKKGIWPVKKLKWWGAGVVICLVGCRLAYGPADATATRCLLLQ